MNQEATTVLPSPPAHPQKTGGRPMKVGIIANELYSPEVGRMGGFGWAVQQIARCFSSDPALAVEPVLLMGERARVASPPTVLHGARVLWLTDSVRVWARRLWQEKFDVLLSIDYRSNYRAFFLLLPLTPIIVWVRDPRDKADHRRIATLRVPDDETVPPQGVQRPNTHSLSTIATLSKLLGRPLTFAVTTPALIPKISDTYRVRQASVSVLPNIVMPHMGTIQKAERPTVAFLGRLDPIKRPWLAIELARRLPEVEFVVMGQSHFDGPGSWQPGNVPGNIRLLGHADEKMKQRFLASAWLLINTSIHESLAISFLEALACEVPLVSCVNPENIVSRFGEWVGPLEGTGMEGLPAFEAAIKNLLAHHLHRQEIGRQGRAWVENTQSQAGFFLAFSAICNQLSTAKHHV